MTPDTVEPEITVTNCVIRYPLPQLESYATAMTRAWRMALVEQAPQSLIDRLQREIERTDKLIAEAKGQE